MPLVLVGVGIWQWWPEFEEWRWEDEREAINSLDRVHMFYEFDTLDNSVTTVVSWGFTEINLYVINMKGQSFSLPEPEHSPTNAYYFVAVRHNISNDSKADGNSNEIGPKTAGPDSRRVTFCAYPAKYDWRHQRTFFIAEWSSHEYLMYGIDNGGMPILEWSEESKKAEKVDDGNEPLWDQLYPEYFQKPLSK